MLQYLMETHSKTGNPLKFNTPLMWSFRVEFSIHNRLDLSCSALHCPFKFSFSCSSLSSCLISSFHFGGSLGETFAALVSSLWLFECRRYYIKEILDFCSLTKAKNEMNCTVYRLTHLPGRNVIYVFSDTTVAVSLQ